MSITRSTTKRQNWWWRHRRPLFAGWLIAFFAVAAALYVLSRMALPTPRALAQSSFIYDANQRELALLDSGQVRVPIRLRQVPQVVIDAVLSTEDRNYYHHGGIDPAGLLRAIYADIRGQGNLQGGSTITQQYVKQVYVGSQRSLIRKIKEAALAIKLQERYSKDQILEDYLNTIYFGRGAYGIEAASRAYFGKDVGELQLPEAALLAGLIRSPELADPSRHPSIARAHRADTLEAMVRDRQITDAERRRANATPLPTEQQQAAQLKVANPNDGSQYFVEYVRALVELQYGKAVVLGGGLRITTTLDSTMQQRAYDAVYAHGGLDRANDPAGALVAIDDQGRVLAMVGGRDYQQSNVNLALGNEGGGTGRQAGSTFKPLLLAATLKEGYSVRSTFPAPPKLVLKHQGVNGEDYLVANYQGEQGGTAVNLVDATALSLNTVYAQLEMDIGPQRLVDMAHQMGVIHANLQPNASLVLGTSEVSVLDMADAYSTLADGGSHLDPSVIAKVTTADGHPLPWPQPKRTPVMTKAQADVATYCLQQVVLRGTGTGAAIGRPVAGKTGTTTNYTDAWFIGYTPKLTAAVWIGDPRAATPLHNIHGVKDVNGGSIPATLFRRFMSSLAADPAYRSYFGSFDRVWRLPGRLLGLPSGVGYPFGTGSTTTTSTIPPATTTTTTTTRPPPTSVPGSTTHPPRPPPTTIPRRG